MRNQIWKMSSLITAAIVCALLAVSEPVQAKNGPKPKAISVFDASKRKRTKHEITPNLSFSAYSNLRYLGERNINRDDAIRDKTDEHALYLGFVGRAKLGEFVTSFVHFEASLKDKRSHARSYGRIMDPQLKEALIAVALTPSTTVTVGRMRFSDVHKWVADASVGGLHYSIKSQTRVFEVAAFTGTSDIRSNYLMAHWGNTDKFGHWGGILLAENDGSDRRLHLAGYYAETVSDTLKFQANVGAVFGDAANKQNAGFGFDLRAIKKLGEGKLKPQLMMGFAYGSKGFKQSGLHSDKTYDGGQTQFHRYGFTYQPELTNLVVLSIGIGVRPSKKFSADVIANLYWQPDKSQVGPDARLDGMTTGNSRHLGSELSLVGAYRPSKKTKFEIGMGKFMPGSAYVDRSSATRIFTRFSVYF